MPAEAELKPPVLVAGVMGSLITLNWSHQDLGDDGWHELTILNTGQIFRTQSNSHSMHGTDGLWRFRVAIYKPDGRNATSNDVAVTVDTARPDIPDVHITADGIVVTLSWNSVPSAVSYEILCNGSWIGDAVGPPDVLTGIQFTHHVWHDGVYNYEVRARNSSGRWSAFSSPVTHIVDTSPPNSPVVEVVPRGLKVRVQWRHPGGKPARYHIRCNGEDIGTTDKTWFETVVQTAGPYSFRVQTEDTEGRLSEWSELTEFSTAFVGRRDR